MAKTRRKYKGNATSTTIPSGLASGATLCTVAAATGWPTSGPFYAVIDPGTSTEEKILVGSISGTSLSSITRGVDDTTDQTHQSNCTIYQVFTAVDADEANELASTWTTKGDLVTHGASTFARLAAGTNNHVLMADSTQSAGLKYALISASNIDSDAVTTAKILDGAVTSAKILDGTIVAGDLADGAVTSAKILDGTIVNADINANAAIAFSKLDTGTLPSTIKVTTDNITDLTIVNADIATNAAIALSKLATGALPTAITVASANIVDGTIVEADIADKAVSTAKIKAEGYTSYTPTVTQSVAVTGVTVNYAKYIQHGSMVHVSGSITIGVNSGTSGNNVRVSLPVTAATSTTIGIGNGNIWDASAQTSYGVTCVINSSTDVIFIGSSATGAATGNTTAWGSAPAVGLAQNDVIRFFFSYESA